MATRGKWGITRDADGQLALPRDWPAYWRYPASFVCLVLIWGAFLFVVRNMPSSENGFWLPLILAVLATFWVLSVVYEFAKLLLVLVLFWGGFKLIGAIVPDSWKPVSRTELDEVRANADQALSLAQENATALDDGTSSDSTMATELQEAKETADQAQQEAEEAQARLDAICVKAPSLCY